MNFYSVNTCEKVKSGNILMYNNFLFCQLCILSNFILSTLYFVKFYFVNSEFCQLLFCQLCFGQLLFCQLCFGQLLFCQLCFGQLLFCQIYFDQLCVLSTLFCQLLFCQTMRSLFPSLISPFHQVPASLLIQNWELLFFVHHSSEQLATVCLIWAPNLIVFVQVHSSLTSLS